ncbi:hypothetical protein B0H11DRAFT_2297169 [Mycena galericulata]|nr:hypothetical protein B0H11DRAFT_2297169 [Mycena galericulata]
MLVAFPHFLSSRLPRFHCPKKDGNAQERQARLIHPIHSSELPAQVQIPTKPLHKLLSAPHVPLRASVVSAHTFPLDPALQAPIQNPPFVPDLAKLAAAIQEAFIQLRAKFKKAANKNDKEITPGPEHQNIFKLTLSFVDGTQCTVTVELCARVALMRQILQDSGPKYWDKLDTSLAAIRAQAKGSAKKITKAFHHILTTDQELHGVKDYELDEDIDAFQQEVDDLIDAGAKDVATSVTTEE